MIRENGVELIAQERERQITELRWTATHDDNHVNGELALVAALYATPVRLFEKTDVQDGGFTVFDPWPYWWSYKWDKRQRDQNGQLCVAKEVSNEVRIRDLAKAGALIAAEIDRLQRLEGKGGKG